MARPRKVDGNEEIAPEIETESVKYVPVMQNPYLSDTQREYLFNYEMSQLVVKIKMSTLTYTLIKFDEFGAETAYFMKAYPDAVKTAWKYYKENISDAKVSEFLKKYVIPYVEYNRIDANVVTELKLD